MSLCGICANSCANQALEPQFRESLEQFFRQLQISGLSSTDNAFLCEECLWAISSAAEWREQVDDLEEGVRAMQLVIVKMMRQIRKLMSHYGKEIQKLGDKIKASENETRVRLEVSSRPGPKSKTKAGGVCQLRAGVVKEMESLNSFRKEIDAKLVQQQQSSARRVQRESVSRAPPSTFPTDPLSADEFDNLLPDEPIFPDASFESPVKMELQSEDEEPEEENEDLLDKLTTDLFAPENSTAAVPVVDQGQLSNTKARPEDWQKSFRDHDGILWYGPCRFCGKSFKQTHNLKHHLYMHTGERPYKCHLCGDTFNQPHVLKTHKRKRHGQESLGGRQGRYVRYKCSQCPERFPSTVALKRHVLISHAGEAGLFWRGKSKDRKC